MKLKQSLLALLATSAAIGAAHADINLISNDKGSLDFYSVLDMAVATQDHSLSISQSLPNELYPFQPQAIGGNTHSVSGLISGGLSDPRVGLKGKMNIENGTKAIFNVETGFNMTSGQLNNAAQTLAANTGPNGKTSVNADSSVNGQIFNRAAWFGIDDATYGTFTMGLQNNPMKDEIGTYDPVSSDTFSPFGESGAYGGGGAISEDARMENSFRYMKTWDGFLFDAAYQFGNNTSSNGVVGGSGVGDGLALRVGYDAQEFGVQATYNNFTDAVKATNGAYNPVTINGITIPNGANTIGAVVENTESYLVAAKYTGVQNLNLKAGFEEFKVSAPSDKTSIGSLWGYQVSSVTYLPSSKAQTTDIWFMGGDYNLSNRWNLALGYYNVNIGNFATAANGSGTIDVYSGVLSYHLYKNTDLYVAGTTNKFSGAAFQNAAGAMVDYSTVTAYAVGARVKF